MQYMDVNTASRKWGITGRRVRILCNDGRIDGAVRNGWSWLIPADAPKLKIENTRALGAEVVLYAGNTAERWKLVYKMAEEKSILFIS